MVVASSSQDTGGGLGFAVLTLQVFTNQTLHVALEPPQLPRFGIRNRSGVFPIAGSRCADDDVKRPRVQLFRVKDQKAWGKRQKGHGKRSCVDMH
jgi:hypothetical protein